MNCSICLEIFTKNNIIECNNIYDDNKRCECKICSKCFLINYITNNITYHFNCPNCKQLLNYNDILRVLKNDKDKFNKFMNDNKYSESIYEEFIKQFKDKILNYEKGNISSIKCDKEMFNKYIETKKNDIIIFANRDDEIKCNISMDNINDIINNIINEKIYYKNWQELHKKYNESCLTLINEIEKDLDYCYNNKNNDNKEIINKIKENKKSFVKISSEIINNAKLLNVNDNIKENNEIIDNFSPCPKSECLGHINKLTNRCNNCNNLCCNQCNQLLYEHEQYDKEKDLLFDKNNKIPENHTKNYIHKFNEEEIKELNDIRINLHLEPYKPNKNNEYIISCNRNIYEDYQLIIKDSKPCPNCKEMITRSMGCNQMFCTKCHECFDWMTGKKLDKKLVHNALLADYLESIGKKMDFSDIKCDTLESTLFLQLNKNVLMKYNKTLYENIKSYFRKHNEIKDYVYNNNTRNLNDKIIEILKNFIIEKNTYFIFDMDYSRDKQQLKEWLNMKLNIIKNDLYIIYDEIYGKNIILEYYQTLAQGMNDTFLNIQSYLLEINNKKDENNKCKELYNNIQLISDNLIKWYNEMKELVINTEKILNPQYKLINLNEMN